MGTRRQQIRGLYTTYLGLFGDVLLSINNIETPALDNQLQQRLKKLNDYLNLLQDLDKPLGYNAPQPSNFVVDIAVPGTDQSPSTNNNSQQAKKITLLLHRRIRD